MLLKLLQEIPTQWQVMFPTQEDNRNWLWLSRLAFHSRRASASGPIIVTILEGEVAEEEEIATWKEEAKARMIMKAAVNKQWEIGLCIKDIMTFISCMRGYRLLVDGRKELGDQRTNGFMVM